MNDDVSSCTICDLVPDVGVEVILAVGPFDFDLATISNNRNKFIMR